LPDASNGDLPIVLVPGLICSARLFAEQIPSLWRYGPVTVADHTQGESVPAIAHAILDAAPPRFALAGLSLGGFIAFEIMRQAPHRVAKLALLDTTANPDTPQQTEGRLAAIELTRSGRFTEVIEQLFPRLVHPSRRTDPAVKHIIDLMVEETGPEVFVRHQRAIIARADSHPLLPTIKCPTLVLVGDSDLPVPPALSREMAEAIPDSRLAVIPECGHASTIERPGEVTQALLEWVQR
jgi:pimeloyl-ACP methyl ester carboxylesterase